MSYKQENKNLPPLDKDVVIPAAIRAASLRASALHAEAYNTPEAPPQEAQGTPPAAEGTPPAAEARTPATEPPPGKEPPPAQADTWEHRYKSLKPRFDKQDDVISQLNGRIRDLELSLTQRAAPSPAERRNPDLNFKPLDADEREAYGDDFLDVAARAAREKLDPELKSLRQELEQLKGAVGNVSEDNEKERRKKFYDHLNDQLPSWKTLNRDPKFIAWCNLPDPFSGAIRGAMLNDAVAKGDAPRALRFFNGFLTDEAATAPAGNRPELPRLPNGQANGKVPLENFAAPGRAKAPAGDPPPAEKEIITPAQIAHFYLLVQKGHYKGNEAEKERLEREIFAAQADGRVQ
jgi:hypothetical protein